MTRKQIVDAFHGDAKLVSYLLLNRQLEDPQCGLSRSMKSSSARFRFEPGLDLMPSAVWTTITLTPFSQGALADQFEIIEQSLARANGIAGSLRQSGLMFLSAWLLPNATVKLDYVATIALNLTFVSAGVYIPPPR